MCLWEFWIEQLGRFGHSLPTKTIWKTHYCVVAFNSAQIHWWPVPQDPFALMDLWFILVRPTSDEAFRSLLLWLLDGSSSLYSASVSSKEKPALCAPKMYVQKWVRVQQVQTSNFNEYFNVFPASNKYSLSQWLNFKLFGITYLVGKIKFKLFFSGSIGWVRILQSLN